MVRTLAVFASLSTFLLAADPSYYTVRLGVYQNERSLMEMVEKFTPAMKRTVMFYEKDSLTVAATIPTQDKTILKRLLPAYRKVFDDAYILPVHPKDMALQKKKNLKKIFL